MSGKKLVRLQDEGIVGGVCAGLGRYFNIEPSKVRIAWIIFMLLGGAGILVYLILWLFMPKSGN